MASIQPLRRSRGRKTGTSRRENRPAVFSIPDTAKEKPQRGSVVAVGTGRVENGTKIDMTVKKGDTVLYGKYSGTEINLDGDDLMIMRETDILGVISD